MGPYGISKRYMPMEIPPATSPCCRWQQNHFISHSEDHEFYYFLIHIFSWAVFIYFAAAPLYLFRDRGFAAVLIRAKKYQTTGREIQDRCSIPCFREDQIIVDTAMQASEHDYPGFRFTVTVIADKLKPETVDASGKSR